MYTKRDGTGTDIWPNLECDIVGQVGTFLSIDRSETILLLRELSSRVQQFYSGPNLLQEYLSSTKYDISIPEYSGMNFMFGVKMMRRYK
jgi:hypothetical protein